MFQSINKANSTYVEKSSVTYFSDIWENSYYGCDGPLQDSELLFETWCQGLTLDFDFDSGRDIILPTSSLSS